MPQLEKKKAAAKKQALPPAKKAVKATVAPAKPAAISARTVVTPKPPVTAEKSAEKSAPPLAPSLAASSAKTVVREKDRALDGGALKQTADGRGKYVYCIIQSSEPLRFGPLGIGIDPADVHTINFKDIAAVVSDTPIEVHDPTR
ncbi:MAG TPA: GvpL/GvpF family gas vesicle protein, partial [Myxococcales bacterium]